MKKFLTDPRSVASFVLGVLAVVAIVMVLPMVSDLHPADAGLVATPVLITWGFAINRRSRELNGQ